jgi:hypothetical protein
LLTLGVTNFEHRRGWMADAAARAHDAGKIFRYARPDLIRQVAANTPFGMFDPEVSTWVMDLRHVRDPKRDPRLKWHRGHHPEILAGATALNVVVEIVVFCNPSSESFDTA